MSNRGGETGGAQQKPALGPVLFSIFHNGLCGRIEGGMEEAKVDDDTTSVESRITFKIVQIN